MPSRFATDFVAAALPDLLWEFGQSISVKDSVGYATDIVCIFELVSAGIERTQEGSVFVKRGKVGIPTANAVAEDWQFAVEGGEVNYWRFDRTAGGILNDEAGLFWVPVIFAQIDERGSEMYRQR